MGPDHFIWGKHEKSLTWQPIDTIPDRIKGGQPFLARWKHIAFDDWEVCIAYYGQFGDCWIHYPNGFVLMAEGSSKRGLGEPKLSPEEWCDIPG